MRPWAGSQANSFSLTSRVSAHKLVFRPSTDLYLRGGSRLLHVSRLGLAALIAFRFKATGETLRRTLGLVGRRCVGLKRGGTGALISALCASCQ
jgi:hypothetical protein